MPAGEPGDRPASSLSGNEMEPQWDQETQDRVWREYQQVVARAYEEFPTGSIKTPGGVRTLARRWGVSYAEMAGFICRRKKELEMDVHDRRIVERIEREATMAELTEEVKEQLWQRYQADPSRRGLAKQLGDEFGLEYKQVYNFLYNRRKAESDNGRVRVSGLMEEQLGVPIHTRIPGGVPVADATITPDWTMADVVPIALAECVGLLIEAVRG